MLFRRTLAALFVACAANATNAFSRDDHHMMLRAPDVLSTPYATLLASYPLMPRQATSADIPAREAALATYVPLNPDGTLNQTAWDAKVNAACISRLRGLMRSSNPSGKCLCYNLASLDVDEGVFAADLRMYRVYEPRDEFIGVESANLNVSVGYIGASAINSDLPDGRVNVEDRNGETQERRIQDKRQENLQMSLGEPELVKVNMLMGRIDADKMDPDMTMADLEVLLMPIVTISAAGSATPSGTPVNTTVSANEASFLVGVFADQVVTSDFSAARAAVDLQMEALKNGTIAFVLPGVQIMVFPIGLIITSLWLLIGAAALGWGTWERYTYAKTFRLRVAASEAKIRRTF